jgi:hypothetical protein
MRDEERDSSIILVGDISTSLLLIVRAIRQKKQGNRKLQQYDQLPTLHRHIYKTLHPTAAFTFFSCDHEHSPKLPMKIFNVP